MKKKILNISATTYDSGFTGLTIQREGGNINGRRVGSYDTFKNWPIDRQARRVLRIFRMLNAYTKCMMTGKVSDVR